MKAYILVSLWCEDDPATKLSHAFALQLHARRAAAVFISGEAPAHDDLMLAATDWPDAAIVILAHGGPALSARSGGVPWVDAEGLARLLSGRRIYAFACDTFKPQRQLFHSTFACLAVASCVELFVGHAAPVMTPYPEQGDAARKLEAAFCESIERFIDGEEDAATLRNLGRRHGDWGLAIQLDLPSEDPTHERSFDWSSAAFLGGFFESLRARSKADEVREAA